MHLSAASGSEQITELKTESDCFLRQRVSRQTEAKHVPFLAPGLGTSETAAKNPRDQPVAALGAAGGSLSTEVIHTAPEPMFWAQPVCVLTGVPPATAHLPNRFSCSGPQAICNRSRHCRPALSLSGAVEVAPSRCRQELKAVPTATL